MARAIDRYNVPLVIPQGGGLHRTLTWYTTAAKTATVDLTGRTYTCRVFDRFGDDGSTLLEPTATNAGSGQVVLTADAADTDLITTAADDDLDTDQREVPIGWWELWEDDGTTNRPVLGGPAYQRRTYQGG